MLTAAYRSGSASRRARAVAGFTLLELIVTVTLLGMLVMLSFPSFSSWIRNSQTRTVSEALQTGLRTAQNEALRRNRRVVMFFTDDTPAKNVDASTHPATDATPLAGGKNWALQTAPDVWGDALYISGGALGDVASGVKITATADGTTDALTAVCFNANGRIVAAAAAASGAGVTGLASTECKAAVARFDITQSTARAGDRKMRVLVQLGGQVRMCDPDRPTLSSTSPEGCP